MKIKDIQKEDILLAAQKQFPNYLIEVDHSDLFLEDFDDGEYKADFLEHPFYVSTHYAYEDKLVNGNQTRYKIMMSVIYLKKDAYEILYQSNDRYYFVYEDNGNVKFIEYRQLQAFLKDKIQSC